MGEVEDRRAVHFERIKAANLNTVDASIGRAQLQALHAAKIVDGPELVAKLIIHAVHSELRRDTGLDYGVLRALGIGIPEQFPDDALVPRWTTFKVIKHVERGQVLVEMSPPNAGKSN